MGGTLALGGRCERCQRGLWDVGGNEKRCKVGGNALGNVEVRGSGGARGAMEKKESGGEK